MRVLTPFISFIDRYSRAVDNLTQYASNPASLIWGCLRVLLRVAQSVNFYFEGLLRLIQNLGERLSVFNRYEKHFSEIEDFKGALSDTYMDALVFLRQARAVFVRLTAPSGSRVPVLLKSGMMWLGRAWQNFETEFSDITDRLSRRFDYLGHLVTFIHRDGLNVDMKIQQQFRSETTKALQQIVKASPAEQDDTSPQTDLNRVGWLYGNAGIGKTVMSAVITEHLLKRLATTVQHTNNISTRGLVAYFFFDKSDVAKNTSLAMYRTLIYQLLSHSWPSGTTIEMAFQAAKIYGRMRFSRADGPVSLLRDLLHGLDSPIYLVIDALDECQDISEALGPLIDTIRSVANCRVLFLSRDMPPIRDALSGLPSLRIASESTKSDVDMYLSTAVDQLDVPISNTGLRDDILSRLSRGADGMFLWAHLMVQQLHTATSPADVMNMVAGPPAGLSAFYNHVLQGLDSEPKQWRDLKSNIISRVLCSPRPLKWAELQVSLSLEVREEKNSQQACLQRRPYQALVLKLCQPFVEYHAETDCFRPAHLSAIQFMSNRDELEETATPGTRQLSLPAEHQKIAKLCLNYINLNQVHDASSVSATTYPLESYATAYWCHHLVHAEPDTELCTRAARFLASDERRRVWLTRLLLRRGEPCTLQQVLVLLRQARSWLQTVTKEEEQEDGDNDIRCQEKHCEFDELQDMLEVLIRLDQEWLRTRSGTREIVNSIQTRDAQEGVRMVKHVSTFDKTMVLRDLVREYTMKGGQDEAVALFKAAHLRLENTPGAEPGDAAWLLNGLGLALDMQNLTELSIATQKEALESQLAAAAAAATTAAQGQHCHIPTTMPGPNHALDSLHTMNELGRLHRHLGQVAESEAMHRRALAGLRAAGLPSTDLQVIWTINTLARCLRRAGRPREAIPLHAEALAARTTVLGAAHPFTLWSLSDLAKCHRDAGELETARALLEKHVRGREEALGVRHFDTLWAMGDLGLTCEMMGDLREGLQWHERAWEGQRGTLGEGHPAAVWSIEAVKRLRRSLDEDK
ncbi:hypothetical protein M406DRAFT_69440 [Cryphonectria parasitica EP155]|uniref:NACHT domain-containing protein n=1 Tax=Cryphonectria parasitica (strain ATCC 38755 / EP155) TaxID=660469 RepID=A0A9P4Y6D7_CRYP1|nr:uncharacterized protein M406DRAFT_69440 [Cryphonectria parasitica EP155]KAF3767279.1 hypothetical protein M406DRAFT_69440 [Cryphonectria parasitica EP155]